MRLEFNFYVAFSLVSFLPVIPINISHKVSGATVTNQWIPPEKKIKS